MNVQETIERVKTEILKDIEDGIVPEGVHDFSELHDYVDANTYGGFCTEGDINEMPERDEFFDDGGKVFVAWFEQANQVQDGVNDWLLARP